MITLKTNNVHTVFCDSVETVLQIPYKHILKEKFVKEFCKSVWGSQRRCLIVEYSDDIIEHNSEIDQKKYTIYAKEDQSIYSQLIKYTNKDIKVDPGELNLCKFRSRITPPKHPTF